MGRQAWVLVPFFFWACGDGSSAEDHGSSSGADDSVTDDDGDDDGPDLDAQAPTDGGGSSSSSGAPGPGPTQKCPFTADADGFFTLQGPSGDYTARLPPGYDPLTGAPLRLFVALKGCGDNAANFATWAGVPYALRSTQDYLAIAVGGRDGACWKLSEDTALVTAAIEHVRSCFSVHQKQIVLGGYDSGGELALAVAMHDASSYAGVLVEHSTLSSAVGTGQVDATLANAAWKIPVAIVAGTEDLDYPIAKVRADVEKMQTAGFPTELIETNDAHGGETDDWVTLLPKMSSWNAP